MGYGWVPATAWVAGATGAAVVGLLAVGAVRSAVTDEPVQVLSASDVDRFLEDPEAALAPLVTVEPGDSAPTPARSTAPAARSAAPSRTPTPTPAPVSGSGVTVRARQDSEPTSATSSA